MWQNNRAARARMRTRRRLNASLERGGTARRDFPLARTRTRRAALSAGGFAACAVYIEGGRIRFRKGAAQRRSRGKKRINVSKLGS